MQEAKLRDLIAKDISKLKPGLTFLRKEKYIPNECGTRSFIDLYAKDENGRHVLIEIKRSDAAARQALHEVTKYVEGVKQHLGAKDTEIHVIIASTEWRELLIPFSRFTANIGFSIEGFNIITADDDADFRVESVPPLPTQNGRFIAPWHNIYWYTNEEALEQGVLSIQSAYAEKGVDDYIIITLYFQNRETLEERRASMRSAIAQMTGLDKSELSEDIPDVPVHEYVAYTARQMLSNETSLQMLAKDEDAFFEAQESLEDMGAEELACYLHGSIDSLDPRPIYDFYEIGYPAKFSMLVESENCTPLKLIRHGMFQRNTCLNDEVFYAELRGEDGATGQRFKRTVDIKNLAHVRTLKEDIVIALCNNPVWRNHILRIIDEIQAEFPNAKIEMSIFNPCTGVFTIYYATTREDGLLYIPSYHIIVKTPETVRMYYGILQECGSALTFPQILKKYYDSSIFALLHTMTWGGADSRDNDIIEDLGAQYRSCRVDIDGDERLSSVLKDEKWRPCETRQSFDAFIEYANKNETLLCQIIRKISPRDMGAFVDSSSSDIMLGKYVDVTLEKKNQYYSGAPSACDICKCPFEDDNFMVDGKMRDHSAWAHMCADCFGAYGENIAWGQGQLYKKDDEGWLLVGGAKDTSDDGDEYSSS